jgi:hypothetical protein
MPEGSEPDALPPPQNLADLARSLKTISFASDAPATRTPERLPPKNPTVVTRTRLATEPAPPVSTVSSTRSTLSPDEDSAELDMDSLMDAIARSVTSEYKRFYGS